MGVKNKKAAIELSIGTVVIIVLAISMLILGLILVKNIFGGAITNVDEINTGVQERIKELFQDEDERAVIYLTARTAEVKKGKDYGIAFGVRNVERGNPNAIRFSYVTMLADTTSELRDACGVGSVVAERWIRFGSGDITVNPGEVGFPPVPIRVQIPESAPLCTTRYKITITNRNTDAFHAELGFILEIN